MHHTRSRHGYLLTFVALAAISGLLAGCGTSAPATPTPVAATPTVTSSPSTNGTMHDVVFSIPAGEEGDGIHYRGGDATEMQRTGPAAFTVDTDGSFWVADTIGLRLLHYTASGERLRVIDLDDQPRSLIDVEAADEGLFVLDAFQTPNLVLHLERDSTRRAQYELPESLSLTAGLTGIAVGEDGEPLAELMGGASLFRLLDDQGKVAPNQVSGYTYRGRVYVAQPAQINTEDNTRGTLMIGDRRVEVKTVHFLGGLRVIGFHPDDHSVYVRLEEVDVEQGSVDQTVRRYSIDGEMLGMARVPIAEQYTYVQNGLAVGPDGSVYALITRPNRVEIQHLKFTDELEPILPPPATPTR